MPKGIEWRQEGYIAQPIDINSGFSFMARFGRRRFMPSQPTLATKISSSSILCPRAKAHRSDLRANLGGIFSPQVTVLIPRESAAIIDGQSTIFGCDFE